mmetsp:Transcript_17900/g.57912  ORF Transcript_17900/g.57912 Transcript_17900/m.57912 type:complete len:311 (-) Transcript_17900:412-1344(-)
MKKVLLLLTCLILPRVVTLCLPMPAPRAGAVRRRDFKLSAVSVGERRLVGPPDFDSVSCAVNIPSALLDVLEASNRGFLVLLALDAFNIIDVDFSPVTDLSNNELTLAGIGFTLLIPLIKEIYENFAKPPPPTPQKQIREKLMLKYNPPASNPWSGTNFVEQDVLDFVTNNTLRKTLVLVDPTGTAKPDLLDGMFRGQTRIVAPAMKKLSLDEDISNFFDLPGTKGLDTLANLIEKGIKPDLGGMPVTPAKLIVDLVDVDDDTKIRSVVKEVKLLKEKAGTNVITIVVVANGASIQALPPVTQNALQVLS